MERRPREKRSDHKPQGRYEPFRPLAPKAPKVAGPTGPSTSYDNIELAQYETYSSQYAASNGSGSPTRPLSPQSSSATLRPTYHSLDHQRGTNSGRQPNERRSFSFVSNSKFRIQNWQRANPYYGWRLGVLCGLGMSIFVLFANIILLIIGVTTKGGYSDGIATLHQGSAQRIGRLSTMYHVLINVLSTLLLAASNYTMQVLCSPRRQDVDRAHAKGHYLNIGILSAQNIRWISPKRRALWLLLALSSVPLHLFYNAAIFKVTTGNQFNAVFVSSLDKTQIDTMNRTMHNLSNTDWKNTYKAQYVSETNDVYFVIDMIAVSMEYLDAHTTSGLNASTTKNLSSLPEPVFIDPGNRKTLVDTIDPRMTEGNYYAPGYFYSNIEVDNGYSEDWDNVPRHFTLDLNRTLHIQRAFANPVSGVATTSKVQIALSFMIVVIVCNVLKALTLLLVFMDRDSTFLVTNGDAVASFLARPDPTTVGCCITPYDRIEKRIKLLNNDKGAHPSLFDGEIWQNKLRLLDSAVSSRRGYLMYALSAILITSGVAILTPPGNFSSARPWGAASSQTFTLTSSKFSSSGILLTATVANLPQLLLSIVYVTFNGIFTLCAMSYEWNSWGSGPHKGLRVTKAEGMQRSTHFLQLPYKWAIPLTITSGVLHWLLSETLFLVRADIRSRTGELVDTGSISACGYSMSSFLALFVVALCLMFVTTYCVTRRIRQDVPFAAASSLVLSAACQPMEGDVDAHLKEVRWGVVAGPRVREDGEVEGDPDVVGHCAFSSAEVGQPVVGRRYA